MYGEEDGDVVRVVAGEKTRERGEKFRRKKPKSPKTGGENSMKEKHTCRLHRGHYSRKKKKKRKVYKDSEISKTPVLSSYRGVRSGLYPSHGGDQKHFSLAIEVEN